MGPAPERTPGPHARGRGVALGGAPRPMRTAWHEDRIGQDKDMSNKKRSRSEAAMAGTKADPNRMETPEEDVPAKAREAAPRALSKRQQTTKRYFTVIEVVLAVTPIVVFAMLGASGVNLTQDGLESLFSEDPSYVVSFFAACIQTFAAWILRVTYTHYEEGDNGYAFGNLTVLFLSEVLLQNFVGIAGIVVLLWRVWDDVRVGIWSWLHERRVSGVLFDVSGAIVILVFALICAVANARIAGTI